MSHEKRQLVDVDRAVGRIIFFRCFRREKHILPQHLSGFEAIGLAELGSSGVITGSPMP